MPSMHEYSIPASDRGLRYGDGLFETMLLREGRIALWDLHWQRLQAGCKQLAISMPPRADVERALGAFESTATPSMVRLTVTRGDGGEGYAPPVESMGRWWLSTPTPVRKPACPIRLTVLETYLSLQPALAGLKHLGRLEQVLAAREAMVLDGDGLLLDAAGRIIEAVASNVFLLLEDAWVTPSLDRCGVAGVMRAWFLRYGDTAVQVRDVDSASLGEARAMIVCNSVRGATPVCELVCGSTRHTLETGPAKTFSQPANRLLGWGA